MLSKKKKSFLNNSKVGHFFALLFFMGIAYGFYAAASNMNYIWKWNSVPKYFFYEDIIEVEALNDGKLVLENGIYYIDSENKYKLDINNEYTLFYDINEEVYEGDIVASLTTMNTGPIINGLWITLKISFFAAILTFILGIIVAFMKLSSYVFLKDIASVYITIIRGTPLLVQIFLFYFIVANIFELERFVAGVLSLGIFFSAYMAEILRSAIQSIDKGQLEAASSLGISHFDAMRHIILPQAFKRALPTLVGEMISLVKDSSLVSVISITDLTKVGKEIVANTFSPFETWIVIALVYLSLTFTLTFIGHKLEKRMSKQGGIS